MSRHRGRAGAPGRDRTADRPGRNRVLCPLSYRGKRGCREPSALGIWREAQPYRSATRSDGVAVSPTLACQPRARCTSRGNSRRALGGTRTPNRLIRNQVLYPLSYKGKSLQGGWEDRGSHPSRTGPAVISNQRPGNHSRPPHRRGPAWIYPDSNRGLLVANEVRYQLRHKPKARRSPGGRSGFRSVNNQEASLPAPTWTGAGLSSTRCAERPAQP